MAYARTFPFNDAALADIECAVGEALANATEHGHRDGTGVSVRAYLTENAIVFEVEDEGCGFRHAGLPAAVQRPPSESPRGFGMYIMRTLMDGIAYNDRGTCVRLTKRLPPAASAGACASRPA